MATIRKQPDAYVKEKYGIDPEILPFSKEDYGVYRRPDTCKWFAVFIVKDRSAFGFCNEVSCADTLRFQV